MYPYRTTNLMYEMIYAKRICDVPSNAEGNMYRNGVPWPEE
jgi:hypothetical protein